MSSFIERMQLIANDKEEVQKSIYAAHVKKIELRKDQLFKKLTYKYYDKIKTSIQNASKFGRQYAYINFEYMILRRILMDLIILRKFKKCG